MLRFYITKDCTNKVLKFLEKAKEFAILNEEKNLAYEIVELEKVIESQYITRSISNRADELTIQAKELSALNVLLVNYLIYHFNFMV